MNEIRSWTIRDAAETYNVNAWGAGYFRINEAGHIEVTPDGNGGPRSTSSNWSRISRRAASACRS